MTIAAAVDWDVKQITKQNLKKKHGSNYSVSVEDFRNLQRTNTHFKMIFAINKWLVTE